MRRSFPVVLATLCCMLTAGCGGATPVATTTTAPPVKKTVVVTTPVLGDFVTIISSGAVKIRVLVPQNTDVRNYVMTPTDVTDVANADLIIENGMNLEPWFDSFIKTAEHRGPVVTASTGIAGRVDETGATDPFVWVGPSNARIMVANVQQALSTLVSAAKTSFAANERGYDAQIDGAISYAQGVTADVRSKALVYAGEPLGYFCDQFQLTCSSVSLKALPSGTPTSAQVDTVVTKIKEAKPVAVVFGVNTPAPVAEATKKALPTVKVTSGTDALQVASVGNQSNRHGSYLELEQDIADLVSAQLR